MKKLSKYFVKDKPDDELKDQNSNADSKRPEFNLKEIARQVREYHESLKAKNIADSLIKEEDSKSKSVERIDSKETDEESPNKYDSSEDDENIQDNQKAKNESPEDLKEADFIKRDDEIEEEYIQDDNSNIGSGNIKVMEIDNQQSSKSITTTNNNKRNHSLAFKDSLSQLKVEDELQFKKKKS